MYSITAVPSKFTLVNFEQLGVCQGLNLGYAGCEAAILTTTPNRRVKVLCSSHYLYLHTPMWVNELLPLGIDDFNVE